MEFISRFFNVPDQSCFLFGPRGTGKSTWLRHQLPDALFLDLLEPALHRSLSARPERLRELLAGSPRVDTVVIDEIQRVPELLTVVHALIEEPSPPPLHIDRLQRPKTPAGRCGPAGRTGRAPHHASLHGRGTARFRSRTGTGNGVAAPGHVGRRPPRTSSAPTRACISNRKYRPKGSRGTSGTSPGFSRPSASPTAVC